MKKVVIHLINSKIFSGLENVACDIIQNTSSEFKNIYVTQNGPIIETLKDKNIEYEIIDNMSIKEVKRVVKKYNSDVIHAHDFTASCIAALSLVRVPIVSHLHHNAPWLKKINIKTILYMICSFRFKKIYIVSPAIEQEYIFSKVIKNKFECIGNPVSVKKITNMIEINSDTNKKKYDICCIGRLTEAKNPLKWLRIIKEVKKNTPTLKCVWVGDGEMKNTFVEEIEKLGLRENIEMPGFKKNPYNYLNSSKIYLQTSSWEGYGLTAFEALALGVPAIVSNVGGLMGIVNDTCGKLCSDEKEFVNETLKYLNDESYYKDKRIAANIRAKELDNSQKYYENIKKQWEMIINEKKVK